MLLARWTSTTMVPGTRDTCSAVSVRTRSERLRSCTRMIALRGAARREHEPDDADARPRRCRRPGGRAAARARASRTRPGRSIRGSGKTRNTSSDSSTPVSTMNSDTRSHSSTQVTVSTTTAARLGRRRGRPGSGCAAHRIPPGRTARTYAAPPTRSSADRWAKP